MPNDQNIKNMLVVVHGMGEDTREGVEAEVKQVLSDRLGANIEDKVDVRAIAYNRVFNDWRRRAADDWKQAVNALEGRVHFTRAKSFLEKAVKVNDDNFYATHWLDVVLYMSTLGVRVQLEVARQMTQILQEYNNGGNLNSRKIVLMAHSLGTAVTHDTLHKMWHGGFEDARYNNLSKMPFAFSAFYQLANTSRLLKTGVDPTSRQTAVRPAPSGMMERMVNVHHKFDPIALVKAFRIDDLDRWLPEQDWPDEFYFDVELSGVHAVNVHGMTHYLSDPRLHCPLFNLLIDDYSYPPDRDAQYRKHDKGVFGKKVDKLRASIEAIDYDEIESISEIAEFWKKIEAVQTDAEAKLEDLTAALQALAGKGDE